MRAGWGADTFNVGYGRGLSVREVIANMEQVIGRPLPVIEAPGRRAGDPPALVSDPSHLKTALGWKPAHEDLHEIIRSALEWERQASTPSSARWRCRKRRIAENAIDAQWTRRSRGRNQIQSALISQF